MSFLPDTVLFVSDLHASSFNAPWPRKKTPEEGHSDAKYLTSCWEHNIELLPEVDLLVLMGDLIDGPQRKSASTNLFSPSLGHQVKGAIDLLEPLIEKVKPKRIYRVDGTDYHDQGQQNPLLALDIAFEVAKTAIVFDIRMANGEILNVAHHPSGGGSAVYQGTKVDRESMWATVAAAKEHVPKARFVVRGHLHNYFFQETRDATIILLPCWQLPTPYAKTKNYYRFQPDLGNVLMTPDTNRIGGYAFTPVPMGFYDLPVGHGGCVNDIE